MDRSLITQTSLKGLRPQGVRGRRVMDSWEQIHGYVASNLDANHANLFAEPVISASGNVDWYAADGEDAVPFARLSADQQAQVLSRLEARRAAILEKSDELVSQRNPAAQRLGEALRAALAVPSDAATFPFLYSVNGEPVLIRWGATEDVPNPPNDPLREFIDSRRRSEPVVVPRVSEGQPAVVPAVPLAASAVFPWAWLLWLLLAVIIGSFWYTMLLGCGINGGSSLLNYCPGGHQAQIDTTQTEELRRELEFLEGQLRRAPACGTGLRPFARPMVPTEDFAERREAQGGAVCPITVTLIWNSQSDLDLYVKCPNGEEISYRNKSACGGTLDVDQNVNSAALTNTPVENICLRPEGAARGTYKVSVKNQKRRPGGPGEDAFKVQLLNQGQTQERMGRAGAGQTVPVLEFQAP